MVDVATWALVRHKAMGNITVVELPPAECTKKD